MDAKKTAGISTAIFRNPVPLLLSFFLTHVDLALEFVLRLFEFPHALADAAGQLRDFLRSEEEKHDQEDDDHLLHSQAKTEVKSIHNQA
jgi:hypothetical protein